MELTKATPEDFKRLWSVYRCIQMIESDRPWESMWNANTDLRLKRLLTVLLGRLEYHASLMRVVMGCELMINAAADKSASVYKLRPLIEAALATCELHPIANYSEHLGPVICWKVPIDEPPIVASPGVDVLQPANHYTHYSLLPAVNAEGLS